VKFLAGEYRVPEAVPRAGRSSTEEYFFVDRR